MPRATAYIDGFNLYFGSLRHRPSCKWLDVTALVELLVPEFELHRVRYFTALVEPRLPDLDQLNRQLRYLAALEADSRLTVHRGFFLTKQVALPTVLPPSGLGPKVRVWKTEEKGSDVNLASWLVRDLVLGESDAAIIISNDSDFAEPVRMIRREFGKQVVVLDPHPRFNAELGACASRTLRINRNALRKCQLPNPVLRPDGSPIFKPAAWS